MKNTMVYDKKVREKSNKLIPENTESTKVSQQYLTTAQLINNGSKIITFNDPSKYEAMNKLNAERMVKQKEEQIKEQQKIENEKIKKIEQEEKKKQEEIKKKTEEAKLN